MNNILFLIDIIHMNINIFDHITKYKMIYNKEITNSYRYKLTFLITGTISHFGPCLRWNRVELPDIQKSSKGYAYQKMVSPRGA